MNAAEVTEVLKSLNAFSAGSRNDATQVHFDLQTDEGVVAGYVDDVLCDNTQWDVIVLGNSVCAGTVTNADELRQVMATVNKGMISGPMV